MSMMDIGFFMLQKAPRQGGFFVLSVAGQATDFSFRYMSEINKCNIAQQLLSNLHNIEGLQFSFFCMILMKSLTWGDVYAYRL